MRNRTAALRVKIKNLADEARTIRLEERRALGRTGHRPDLVLYRDLRDHRRGIVRSVARVALLACALIRDTPYVRVEAKCATPPDWAEVRKVAERFGAVRDRESEPLYAGDAAWAVRKAEQAARFDAWLTAAKAATAASAAALESAPKVRAVRAAPLPGRSRPVRESVASG